MFVSGKTCLFPVAVLYLRKELPFPLENIFVFFCLVKLPDWSSCKYYTSQSLHKIFIVFFGRVKLPDWFHVSNFTFPLSLPCAVGGKQFTRTMSMVDTVVRSVWYKFFPIGMRNNSFARVTYFVSGPLFEFILFLNLIVVCYNKIIISIDNIIICYKFINQFNNYMK